MTNAEPLEPGHELSSRFPGLAPTDSPRHEAKDSTVADKAGPDPQDAGQGSGRGGLLLGALAVAVACLVVGGVVVAQSGDEPEQAEGQEVATASPDEAAAATDPVVDPSVTPSIVDLDDYDDEDSMRIEIPLAQPETLPATDGSDEDDSTPAVEVNPDLAPLKMVISEGALVLQGTASDQAHADVMMEQAKEVFGAEEIVEEYKIDPAAPQPSRGIVVQKPIVFETGSAEIREEFKPILDACADVLKSNPSLVMNVSGHTDDTGTAEANLALAEARAKAVIEYYITQGIETETFDLTAAGADRPIDSNETGEGRESNRRTDLEFVGIFDEVLDESGEAGDSGDE